MTSTNTQSCQPYAHLGDQSTQDVWARAAKNASRYETSAGGSSDLIQYFFIHQQFIVSPWHGMQANMSSRILFRRVGNFVDLNAPVRSLHALRELLCDVWWLL